MVQGSPPSKSSVDFVPVANVRLSVLPTEINLAAFSQMWEVDQTLIDALDDTARFLNGGHALAYLRESFDISGPD